MSRATAGDEWISSDEVPDPNPLPVVVGWKVLIRPVAIKTKTKGGILLPEQYASDVAYLTTVGRVLALGNLAYKHPDFEDRTKEDFLSTSMIQATIAHYPSKEPPQPWCAVGDYVCYGKFAGTKFLYKGVKLILMEDRLIDMVIPDPAFIDPQFNISNG